MRLDGLTTQLTQRPRGRAILVAPGRQNPAYLHFDARISQAGDMSLLRELLAKRSLHAPLGSEGIESTDMGVKMMNRTLISDSLIRAIGRPMAVVAALTSALGLSASASADIVHDESINGDFSNDQNNPTQLALSLGINSILATSVQGDREYVTVTIPIGMELSELILVSYAGIDETAFIAVQSGPVITEPPTGTNPANLLGWAHFGPALGNVGLDILPEIAIGADAIGFTPPLPAGTYAFWIQQTGVNAATYQFDFVLVPAPGVAALLAIGALGCTRRRRTC